MKDGPNNVNDMLRRALEAQVELGLDEMIVSGSALAVAEMKEEVPVVSGSDDDAIDMFTGVGPALAAAEYKSLELHREDICNCHLCPLGDSRTKFVYGVGNPEADLMFVGEAPGRDEDLKGEPFVGRAGQLLDKILTAMQMQRDQVYIANILKCRPPANRDPQPEEMEKCFPYLREQARLIKPKIICALGRIAAQALLETKTPLGKLRGKWHSFEGVPTLVTYHPAALLRFPKYKRDTWEDMQLVIARLKSEQ